MVSLVVGAALVLAGCADDALLVACPPQAASRLASASAKKSRVIARTSIRRGRRPVRGSDRLRHQPADLVASGPHRLLQPRLDAGDEPLVGEAGPAHVIAIDVRRVEDLARRVLVERLLQALTDGKNGRGRRRRRRRHTPRRWQTAAAGPGSNRGTPAPGRGEQRCRTKSYTKALH